MKAAAIVAVALAACGASAFTLAERGKPAACRIVNGSPKSIVPMTTAATGSSEPRSAVFVEPIREIATAIATSEPMVGTSASPARWNQAIPVGGRDGGVPRANPWTDTKTAQNTNDQNESAVAGSRPARETFTTTM